VGDQRALDLVGRVEGLLDEIDALPQSQKVVEVVQALVEMYGEGLARIMEMADGTRDAFADDELVAHLLLLHDLHPVPVEERVRGAIATAGAAADLLAIEGGVVRLRAKPGSCAACASSAGTKQAAIEEAIAKAAPEVERVEFWDAPEPALVLPQVTA
jgi:Fe-S cluster biogenesis protein NfuA